MRTTEDVAGYVDTVEFRLFQKLEGIDDMIDAYAQFEDDGQAVVVSAGANDASLSSIVSTVAGTKTSLDTAVSNSNGQVSGTNTILDQLT